jgi:UDP-galactopyranose mutase
MSQYDLCIVGAGLSGATIARLAAEDGKKVLILEKRDHIGGNVYDKIDDTTGIRISMYGAHIFHTNDTGVWNFVNRFGSWKRWDHRVVSDVSGSYVSVPINITTVNSLFNENLSTEEDMLRWLSKEQIVYNTIQNSEDSALSKVGSRIYETLLKPYTIKQWAKEPKDLDPSVLERIPLRTNFDTRYFTDKYQAMPEHGYSSIVKSMLDHPNITVTLNCPWSFKMEQFWKTLIFTGPIDTYFEDSGLPKLEYRSIHFIWEKFYQPGLHQPAAVVNYPSLTTPYTRCVEYKHFLNQKSPWTIIASEITCEEGEPYYPVPTQKNKDLYEKYRALAEATPSVHFVGRLASYKYFNMDQAIRNAMDYYATLRQSQNT